MSGPDPRTLTRGALVVLDVHGVVFTNPFPGFIREIGERVGVGGDELFGVEFAQAAGEQLLLDDRCETVGLLGRNAGGQQARRHDPTRERQPVVGAVEHGDPRLRSVLHRTRGTAALVDAW